MRASSSSPERDSPYPGVERRTFDTAEATVVEYTFGPGASFPLHRHPQEQVTVVREGAVALRAGGRITDLLPGEWMVIAGGLEHGITAGESGASFLAILVPRRQAGESIAVTDHTTLEHER